MRPVQLTKEEIIASFPGLSSDPYFNIKSDCTPNYNCIAWAAIRDDINWWPDPRLPFIDGVEWPFNLPVQNSVQNFVDLYGKLGYNVCPTWRFEPGLQKIAIYKNLSESVTHAARQNSNGIWTSKLGPQHDILHLNPLTLEGREYGQVSTIMCRDNSSYTLKGIKKLVEVHKPIS